MRALLLVAALALAAPAHAAERETYQVRHTTDLVRICATDPGAADYGTAIAFCHGILVGAYGYFLVSTAEDARYVCPPTPRPTRAKVMNDFVAWAKARPKHDQSHSVDTLFRYLAETYPCRK